MRVVSHQRATLSGLFLSATAVVCATYLAALGIAEVLLLTTGLVAGAIAHVVLVAVLMGHAIAAPRAPYQRLLVALALPSLVRLLGLIVPVAATPLAVWYLAAGIPALLAVVLAARVVELPPGILAWPRPMWVQLLIAASGISNGLLAYLVLRPAPAAQGSLMVPIAAVSVVIFGALVEELAFHGILQGIAGAALGSPEAGVAVSTTAITLLYIGSLSVPFVLLMFATALLHGWTVRETGSLWGPLGAHAILVVGLVVIWPLVLT
jgi:membrane protease YdiL (CAAX protease family)